MKANTTAQLIDSENKIIESIIQGFEERIFRTQLLYDNIPKDNEHLLPSLTEDLQTCYAGSCYFKALLGPVSEEEKALANEFKPENFCNAFNSWFHLEDTSEEGYKKDFELREKISYWLKLQELSISPTF